MSTNHPTAYAELNAVLHELVTSVQAALADNFVAAYLQGSFAIGDWDSHSDVDFLIAVAHEISATELARLQAMHARIYDLDTDWARHLEGSYVPIATLRRGDPTKAPLLYLDNTSRELVRSNHDNTLVVRWVVREHGIRLAGPAPDSLIDPVPEDELRREVLTKMRDWAHIIFTDPDQMNNRWYQPYAMLSYCRMLHTLQTGRVASKLAGAAWAKGALDRSWADLIQRAWEERPDPSLKVRQPADPDDLKRTLDFIGYALAVGSQSEKNAPATN